jgi:hypothetical protein
MLTNPAPPTLSRRAPPRFTIPRVLALLILGSLLGGSAFAAADRLLTSKDIKDGSLQNRDIRSGVISMSRLTPRSKT